jgi:hypothetical protein
MADRRTKRHLHAFDADGMVLCNPRDREAAHRAEVEGIATDDVEAVTCRKCLGLITKTQRRAKHGAVGLMPVVRHRAQEQAGD